MRAPRWPGKRKVRPRALIMTLCAILGPLAAGAAYQMIVNPRPTLVLATTTSTLDSGLLDHILPAFRSKAGCDVKVIAVGTGQALEYGKRGDADVVLVHSMQKELDFVAQGYGLYRKDVMYNRFVIVGPANDPAHVDGLTNATETFRRIAQTGSFFCSRADDSGTYTKEVSIWNETKMDPSRYTATWYLKLGQGMGPTLVTANQKPAYTLTDEGTWYAMEANLGTLRMLSEGDPILRNQYGVIPVKPSASNDHRLGEMFASWITSAEVQSLVAAFKVNGHQLFTPNATGG